jgi:hypothetical protein
MHSFYEKKLPKNSASFCYIKKLPKENNRPKGENSTNLVTLHSAHPADTYDQYDQIAPDFAFWGKNLSLAILEKDSILAPSMSNLQ